MGIALDTSNGFKTSQNLSHALGLESKQSIGGSVHIDVLLKKHLSEWAKAYLPLFGSLAPDCYRAFL